MFQPQFPAQTLLLAEERWQAAAEKMTLTTPFCAARAGHQHQPNLYKLKVLQSSHTLLVLSAEAPNKQLVMMEMHYH